MNLTSDRLDVVDAERIRMVLLVGTPMVLILAQGGTDHLKHEIGDIGFRDVDIFVDAPASWHPGTDRPKPIGLDWLVWVEATPLRSASLSRALTEDLNVLDAWRADDDHDDPAPPHPYAVVCFIPARIFGLLRAFGVAYPLDMEVVC